MIGASRGCSSDFVPFFFFLSGASLNGWRWGKCARCATCQSCSLLNRLVAQIPQCRYSSLCLALRTWCSRLKSSQNVHYRHTNKHPITYTPTCTGMSLRTSKRNWSYCADAHKKCESVAIITSYLCIVSLKDFLISALTDNQRFAYFSFHGQWRRVDVEDVSFSAVMWSITFSQPKHFFWGHQLKTRRKKTQKPRTTIH